MAKKVIVGLGCGVAVLRGANVFAQGVMGAPKSKSIYLSTVSFNNCLIHWIHFLHLVISNEICSNCPLH